MTLETTGDLSSSLMEFLSDARYPFFTADEERVWRGSP
jgi:hypothetical protein